MLQTSFWSDFARADRFGLLAVQDTVNRGFAEWKKNYKYLTKLILVLNHKIWQHNKADPEMAKLNNSRWMQADQYAIENLKGSELEYYYEVTD